MASAPATPKAASATPTGAWRHPRLDEINKRIGAKTFNEQNVHAIVWNALAFISTFVVPHILYRFIPFIFNLFPASSTKLGYLYWAVRAVFLGNAIYALKPLYTKADDLSDIPLTPSQRALLGLPPSNAPLTPGSQYITPPRYARSTPRSASSLGSSVRAQPGTARSANSSPLAGRGQESNSFSPSPLKRDSSPLLKRRTGEDATRRLSYGSQSPLAVSHFMDSTTSFGGSTPPTPTPASASKPASVGLNNKWLYERGRGSPSQRSVFT
ncbi:hypothetical protein EJ05DRAFT_503750 [Pseudovirgaria hyperparasitica]|uniref:Nuclear pore complex component n=1 Tax=Pseudovirgaria hyperparasitica TaxID=470096 RepID=A0A6A6VYA9_9PEZI|nr:uncharacterized protein EJ05DRAFT_503750 [Pseudovirgaria hyperparasitica]KAF2754806.1 hypothetical protein EJ05DRAFT_503750 [Pseudovirgaria hyperparasitica]